MDWVACDKIQVFRWMLWGGLLLPFALCGQFRLEVEAVGVASSEGSILVALYTEEAGFLKFDQVYRSAGAPAVKGTTRILIEDLPQGDYALAIFHDENGNEELDANWLGIPREPLGFSQARMKTFGPPKFRECLVSLTKDTVIRIPWE